MTTTTRTINGNNAANNIVVSDFSVTPGSGYTVTGASSTTTPPALPGPFFETDLVINTFDAGGGTDFVNLSGLITGVSFTSITINGGGGSQNVTGSGFAETISTGAGNDTINSGAGDDTLTGGGNADSMDGGDGSDIYNIAGNELGGDTFNDTGTSGSDTINVTGALSTFLSFGKAGTDYSLINPLLPASALATYKGIEIFNGNNFAINGSNGSDIFDLSGFSSATQVGAINTFDVAAGTADYVNVSTADAGVTVNGGGGKQIVIGSNFVDTIDGKSGDDEIYGGAGDDTITGGSGADKLYGDTAAPTLTTIAFVGGEAQTSINTKFAVTATGGGVTYRQTSQGGVSTRGYGVNNPNDVGVQGTRGIDGDGANGNPTETLIVRFADTDLAAVSASLTLGVNKNANNGNDYIVEAFYGITSLGSVTGGFGASGANYLQTVNLDFGGQLFDKVTIRNAQFTTTDAFVLSAASFLTVDETTIGNDTFLIQNGQVNTGDLFDGGLGNSDKILNVGGAIGLTQFGVAGIDYASTIFAAFTGAPTAAGATYKNVEIFDGNNAAITGSNNGFDILDFSGFQTATKLGTINTLNATGGADYVNVSTADADVTVNGGAGTQIIVGSAYADTLTGGAGTDNLTGGAGNDWFRYNATNEGTDTITDFVSGTDKFLFEDTAFSNAATFTSNATGTAIGANAQFIYNTSTGALSYDSNGTLGGGSSSIAFLTGNPPLVGTDVLNFI
jgi:Ca2+-binding RTX toxin-like protein